MKFKCQIVLMLVLPALLIKAAVAAEGGEVSVQADKSSFAVQSRKHRYGYVPCDDCHDGVEVIPEVLEMMTDMHDMEVTHGNADLQCNNCHMLEKDGSLHTLSGKAVELDRSYLVCAQCHSGEYRDWQHGAHGKRVKRWRGGREVLNCTECHNPHNATGVQPRAPMGPPGVRQRLEHQQHRHRHGRKLWERSE
jgi:hypothetical protein